MSSDAIVIVGGGLAAARAIEAIRESDRDTPIVLVGEEDRLPYERPPLSKAVLIGNEPEDSAYTHPQEWYDERQVELRLGTRATAIDPQAHAVTLDSGDTLDYGRLLITTGSTVRHLDLPGSDLLDIFYLRSMPDSAAIKARLVAGSEVVIVGAGWIGLEVAAAAREHGCEVTVIEPQPTPLNGVVGDEVGSWFAELHRSHGVNLLLGQGVQSFEGNDKHQVAAVVTGDGQRIPADTVVVGVGITPNTQLAEAAGLAVDNGITVDAGLRTSAPDVWAAGDVANWDNPTLGEHVRVEHWANAQDGGYAAGRSIVGEDVSYDVVPFFFSDQYDVGLEYAGHVPRGTDAELVLRGEPASNEFMAFWVVPEGSGHRVLAGMHVNVWDSIDAVQDLVRKRTPVDTTRLADPEVALGDVALERPDSSD